RSSSSTPTRGTVPAASTRAPLFVVRWFVLRQNVYPRRLEDKHDLAAEPPVVAAAVATIGQARNRVQGPRGPCAHRCRRLGVRSRVGATSGGAPGWVPRGDGRARSAAGDPDRPSTR